MKLFRSRRLRQQQGLLWTALFLLCGVVHAKNMNNGEYWIANAFGGYRGFDTEYKAEFFEVYSPVIRSYYSQVFWATMDPVPLPAEIIERFSGNDTIMAIVGYEVDQVHVNDDGTETPIPITHAYNHHYIAYMFDSKKTRLEKKTATMEMMHRGMSHGGTEYWDFVEYDGEYEVPSGQAFSEGNGGEMRISYHGYPKGYAQLIRSPDTWQINPMQIDTWNRKEPSPKFKTGPLPKVSPVYNDSTAIYSGLLECPCTDRMVKKWVPRYKLITSTSQGGCQADEDRVENATECFQAGQSIIPAAQVETHSLQGDKNQPLYCSVNERADGTLDITWNEPNATNSDHELEEQQQGQVVAFASNAINATVTLNSKEEEATVTLVGPADKWFGIGFGFDTMCRRMEADECQGGGPYAIIVYEDNVEERQLDFHGKGKVLLPTIKVLSNTVVDGNRTVVISRPLEGPDERYYSFDVTESSVPVIMARGCNMTFAQHCGHGASQLNFLEVDTPMQICRDGVDMSLGGAPFKENRCAPFPTSTLLEQRNPTCFLESYSGGLQCCRHLHSLLDSDQQIPWKDQLLEYQLKFRYYFEEYTSATATTKASHQPLSRLYWATEAFAGEYDITPCPPGTPPSQCVQVITSRWPISRMMLDCDDVWCTGKGSNMADGVELIYAGPHCHAPSCLSMELYNADTGELLCRVEPRPGQSTDRVYDELGFLAIPPCLWGSEDETLMNPVFLPLNTTLLSIKRNNNTIGHFGDMASWQMRGVVIMDKEEADKERARAVNQLKDQEMKSDLTVDKEQKSTPRTSVRSGRNEV